MNKDSILDSRGAFLYYQIQELQLRNFQALKKKIEGSSLAPRKHSLTGTTRAYTNRGITKGKEYTHVATIHQHFVCQNK